MEREPHIIRRQLLEFVTADTAGSYALQDEVVLLYNELVLPMIDRCFSEISAQKHLAPIDLLELDLGTLDRHNLRASFLQQTEIALRKKLAELPWTYRVGEESAPITEPVEKGRRIDDDVSQNAAFPSQTIHFSDTEATTTERNALFHGKTISFRLDDEAEDFPSEDISSSPLGGGPRGRTDTRLANENFKTDNEAASTQQKTSDSPSMEQIRNSLIHQGKTISFNLEEERLSPEDLSASLLEEGTREVTDSNTSAAVIATNDHVDYTSMESNNFFSESEFDENVTPLILPSKGEARSASSEQGFENASSSPIPISLVRHYLQTGLFPWWARETSREAFERAVRECILAGDDLPQLVALLNRPESLLRFTSSLPDEVILAVAAAISPMNETTLRSMQLSWEKLLPSGNLPARQHWWVTVFSASVARRVTHMKAYDPAETIAAFLEPYPQNPADTVEKKYRNTYLKRLSLLEKFFTRNGFAAETEQLRAAHELLSKKGNTLEEPAAEQWKAVHVRLVHGKNSSETTMNTPSISRTRQLHTAQTGTVSDSPESFSPPQQPGNALGFDKIFIENAGLVLLWPFLKLFLERLELTEEDRFKDGPSREKAMIALETVVFGQPKTPFFEASLPLNKILCGIAPEVPVHTNYTFRKAELKVIDGLLKAAISQTPAWQDLSVDAFRQAWLARKGALSVRDGNWLLQVERKTYDVLLSRLPWAINIVKLPWMHQLLVIEWL